LKNFFLLFFLLQLSWLNLVAQSSCPEKFAAYNSQGQRITNICVGERIRFKACDASIEPDKEYYDFDKSNDVAFPDTVKYYTYTTAGTYTVTQLIRTPNSDQASIQNSQNFTVVDAPQPVFTTLACSLNQVKVTITDQSYDKYVVDFGDGTTQPVNKGTSVSVHSYTQGGSYKIRVTGQYNAATCSNFQETTIQTLPAVNPPKLEAATITNLAAAGSVSLNLSGAQPEYYYLVERISNNNSTVIDTIKNPATATITHPLANIDTRTSLCFRIRATDQCGTNLSALSNTVCTVPVTSTNENENISLNWPAYPEPAQLIRYEVLRNGEIVANVVATGTGFQDTKVQCGTRYCYKIIALTRSNSQSTSNEVCETVTSNQSPVPGYLSSTFTPNNTIQLNFVTTENAQEITYQKKTGSSPFTNLTISNQLSVLDQVPSGQQPLCYQATFRNTCNQISAASNITCPVFLEVNSPRNGVATLNWSAYEGFPAGVAAYYIQTLDAAGAVLQTIPVSGTTLNSEITVSENQQVFFRIWATPNNYQAPAETFSNTVIFRQEFKLIIPNAFSPNGDGLNDVFEVKGHFLANYRLLIYDRWGQILFDNNNQSRGWDGRLNGKEIPTGAYPYRITGQDTSGKEFTKTGTVTLLR